VPNISPPLFSSQCPDADPIYNGVESWFDEQERS
jgi:hypothetical protein